MRNWWRSTRARLGRLLALTGAERATLVRAWLLLPLTRAYLRFGSVPEAQLWLERQLVRSKAGIGLAPERVAWLVGVASRWQPVAIRCLPRSLVLQQLLRRDAHDAALCFGVAREESNLMAHAWVEVDGVPLAEPESLTGRFAGLETGG